MEGTLWVDGSQTRVCYIIEGQDPVVVPLANPTTGNRGEYFALLHGLSAALSEGITEIQVYSDSQLMVNQLTINSDGRPNFRCTNPALQALRDAARAVLSSFKSVTLTWVPREFNKAGIVLEKGAPNHA